MPSPSASTIPSQWPADFVQEFGVRAVADLTAWLTSKLVMRLIEDHLNPAPGLYTWEVATTKRSRGQTRRRPPRPSTASRPSTPVLVFIHGTASSTLGSFGAFLAREAQPHWQSLHAFFGEHIYAFEHRTMSESPIENAIQLVDGPAARAPTVYSRLALPRRARGRPRLPPGDGRRPHRAVPARGGRAGGGRRRGSPEPRAAGGPARREGAARPAVRALRLARRAARCWPPRTSTRSCPCSPTWSGSSRAWPARRSTRW